MAEWYRVLTEPAAHRRALNSVRRRIARQAGLVSDQRFYLDSFMVAPRQDVERLGTYAEPVNVTFKLPANGWRVTHAYPPRFVYRLSGASVDPVSNLVYDSKGEFIAESASALPLRRLYDWPQPRLRRPKSVLAGEYVFFPSNPSMYHWFEDLAVFLHAASVAPEATILVAADAINHDAGWNRRRQEVLARFAHRNIQYIDRPTRVDSLVLTAKTGGLGSPAGLETLHPEDVKTIRNHFGDWLSTSQTDACYYLSRRGFSRSPADEPELQRIAESEGFQLLQPADLTMQQQAETFSSAAGVSGLHGAALGNILWLPEGAGVVELFPSSRMPYMFACIAAIRGLTYRHDRYELTVDNRMGASFLDRARSHMADIRPSRASGCGL